jgi:hypothetical protein
MLKSVLLRFLSKWQLKAVTLYLAEVLQLFEKIKLIRRKNYEY